MQDLTRKITEIFDEVPVARDNISEKEEGSISASQPTEFLWSTCNSA